MKATAAFLAVSLLASASGTALAAATPEEAQRLTALFQSYLGTTAGVVSVSPAGEGYATRFDLMPLIAGLNAPGLTASLTPVEWTITPQGGGKWKVDQDQALSLAIRIAGQSDVRAQIGKIKGSGVFDEAIGTFASTSSELTEVAVEQTVTDQNGTARSRYTIASVRAQSVSTGTRDGVNGTTTQSYSGFRQTSSIPAAADGSTLAMDISVSSPEGSQQGAYRGVKAQALTELLAWAVAHHSPDSITAAQGELKEKLRAALPVFSSVSSEGTMSDVSINSVAGRVDIGQLGFEADLNGLVAEGRLREKLTFTGLKLPQELVPQWAASLVPENFSIDFSVTGFDLAKPAAMLIDSFDLTRDPPLPQGFEDTLLRALLPSGMVTLGLGPSEIRAPVYRLSAEGSMAAGPALMPQGQAVLSVMGLDQVMTALQAAPPAEGAQQITPLLLLARGLARQEPDGSLSWAIESTPAGSVTINGTDLSKITGGQ